MTFSSLICSKLRFIVFKNKSFAHIASYVKDDWTSKEKAQINCLKSTQQK